MYMLHSITKYDIEVKYLPREDFILTHHYYLKLRSEILEEIIFYIMILNFYILIKILVEKYAIHTKFLSYFEGAIALHVDSVLLVWSLIKKN